VLFAPDRGTSDYFFRARMREGDMVARFGGEEFAVLFGAPCTQEEADRCAARLILALAEPFQLGEHELRVGGSIGISLAPKASDHGAALDTDMLLRQADIALYRAKREGRGTHRFFEPLMAQGLFVSNKGFDLAKPRRFGHDYRYMRSSLDRSSPMTEHGRNQ
jgi:Diguanylate cyclase, GGDEF domain